MTQSHRPPRSARPGAPARPIDRPLDGAGAGPLAAMSACPPGPSAAPAVTPGPTPSRRAALAWSALPALWLAGCGGLRYGRSPAPSPAPGPVPPASPAAGGPASPPGAAASTPPAPPAPEAPAALSAGQVQRAVTDAVELLEAGKEDEALALIERILATEPGNRLALSLQRQITTDPVATLGRESFPYTVKPSETLSRIAGRFLNDVFLFYHLARYNGIKVPRQLAGGQVIRIPGKAPPPEREPARAPSPPPAPAPAPTPAPPPPAPAVPPAPAPVPAPSPAAQDAAARQREIARLTRAARAAFARQQLDEAIRLWDQVLALDPDNATARLERQRAVELKAKLGKL